MPVSIALLHPATVQPSNMQQHLALEFVYNTFLFGLSKHAQNKHTNKMCVHVYTSKHNIIGKQKGSRSEPYMCERAFALMLGYAADNGFYVGTRRTSAMRDRWRVSTPAAPWSRPNKNNLDTTPCAIAHTCALYPRGREHPSHKHRRLCIYLLNKQNM